MYRALHSGIVILCYYFVSCAHLGGRYAHSVQRFVLVLIAAVTTARARTPIRLLLLLLLLHAAIRLARFKSLLLFIFIFFSSLRVRRAHPHNKLSHTVRLYPRYGHLPPGVAPETAPPRRPRARFQSVSYCHRRRRLVTADVRCVPVTRGTVSPF